MGVIKMGAGITQDVIIDGMNTTVPVVYETRKNRATGSHTQVVDARAYGSRFIAVCVTHNTQDDATARLRAEGRSHISAEWCAGCEGDLPQHTHRATRGMRVQERPRNIVINAMPDEVRTFAGMMGTCTWDAQVVTTKARKRRTTKKA